MFGKFQILLRWKNVLSGSHAWHFRFIRHKSVTRTMISVNLSFMIRCIYGKIAFYQLHAQYSCGHFVASTLHTAIVRASSGRIVRFWKMYSVTRFLYTGEHLKRNKYIHVQKIMVSGIFISTMKTFLQENAAVRQGK